MDGLEKAITAAGGVTKLANLLKVRQSVVSNWRARGQIPVERCREVETATGGKVTCYDLRPDVFPAPIGAAPDGKAAA